MKRLCILLALQAVLAAGACAGDRFDLAITVDDLPSHGPLPAGMSRPGIAQSYLATLKAHRVPEAFGFVNAVKLTSEPGSEAVLDAWRAGGYPLGNHTYSHMDLERAPSLQAWQADVLAGESAVASRMQGAQWRYLRFPFLDAGIGRHDDAMAFLRARGYRVAEVSVSFDDWAYTDTYARCVAKGDSGAIAAMKARYLGDVDTGIARMKDDSTRVFGRVIPQVLLTHLGGWSAVTLPEVMARLDAAGARYVTLAQALADPVYADVEGGNVVARAAARTGVALGSGAAEPGGLDLAALCQGGAP